MRLPLAGATATVALALPAVNRGSDGKLSPFVQGVTLCEPLCALRTTRSLGFTLTVPDQSVQSLYTRFNVWVPAGTTSCWMQHGRNVPPWLNSSPCPTK